MLCLVVLGINWRKNIFGKSQLMTFGRKTIIIFEIRTLDFVYCKVSYKNPKLWDQKYLIWIFLG